MKPVQRERAKDLGSLATVLSVLVILVILVGCPLVGALIEGTIKWEQSFPMK